MIVAPGMEVGGDQWSSAIQDSQEQHTKVQAELLISEKKSEKIEKSLETRRRKDRDVEKKKEKEELLEVKKLCNELPQSIQRKKDSMAELAKKLAREEEKEEQLERRHDEDYSDTDVCLLRHT
jgi:hypothetical protein